LTDLHNAEIPHTRKVCITEKNTYLSDVLDYR